MTIEKIYYENKETIIGTKIEYINNLQKKLINNYDLNSKKLINNESSKHIDPKALKSFDKYFNLSKPSVSLQNDQQEKKSSLTVLNGNNYLFKNADNEKTSFFSLHDNKSFLSEKIERYNGFFSEDYIVDLNTIFLNSGFDFILKDKNEFKLNISYPINNIGSTVYAKNFFKICNDSKLLIVEKINNKVNSNLNLVNYFEIMSGAEVTHLVIQNNSENTNLQFTSHINCNASSKFNQLIFNIGNASIRNHHYANLIGQNSEAKLHGFFAASDNQIIDNKTLVKHLSPNCSSNQTYKAILSGNAKGSYLSKTYVDKKAQKTEGYQLSKGIILSDKAHFHSKPELKIYADDVKCSHGSTIGPFDEDAIFYLRTRGINENQAKSFLIKSFYSDLLNNYNEEEYKSEINFLINNWLKSNL